MRYIEIDGHRVEVRCCEDCPCFADVDYYGNGFNCNHPAGDIPSECGGFGRNCPLREVKE